MSPRNGAAPLHCSSAGHTSRPGHFTRHASARARLYVSQEWHLTRYSPPSAQLLDGTSRTPRTKRRARPRHQPQERKWLSGVLQPNERQQCEGSGEYVQSPGSEGPASIVLSYSFILLFRVFTAPAGIIDRSRVLLASRKVAAPSSAARPVLVASALELSGGRAAPGNGGKASALVRSLPLGTPDRVRQASSRLGAS